MDRGDMSGLVSDGVEFILVLGGQTHDENLRREDNMSSSQNVIK